MCAGGGEATGSSDLGLPVSQELMYNEENRLDYSKSEVPPSAPLF